MEEATINEETTLDKAVNEVNARWSAERTEEKESDHVSLVELLSYLESCGIFIKKEDQYEFVLRLRNEHYREQRIDNELKFVMYS